MLKTQLHRLLPGALGAMLLLLSACQGMFPVSTAPPVTQVPTRTPLPEAMLTFKAQLPGSLNPGESLYLMVMDEVTGLALNPALYPMEAEDATHYVLEQSFPMNTVVKYRYARQGEAQFEEHLSDGRAVRYRLYHVEGPGTVQDVIGRWTDTTFSGPTGRIQGSVVDENGAPVPGVLLAAGGAQTQTNAHGDYLLEALPPGTQNLVAYALDGAYRVYQQGATVAPGSTTPAVLRLTRATLVKVTFTLVIPKGTYPAIPIRLAGSLYGLGNTFGDLAGGVSSSVSRMPILTPQLDGRYSVTLDLPAGADIRYKYTLGDGLWNAEHDAQGKAVLRQLIVSPEQSEVFDQVITWRSGKSAPITFEVTVPTSTPATDYIAIQFNPSFGWTEPLPMWKIGENRWMYTLYSPLDTLGAIGYRYCRNGLCGSADDAQTHGPNSRGRRVNTSNLPQTMGDQVNSWAWISAEASNPVTLPNVPARPRGASFMAGVEFQPVTHPSWGPLFSQAFGDIAGMRANWVFLTPTWTFTRANLPVLEPVAGQDPLWPDTLEMIAQAREKALQVALFPTPRFPGGAGVWWESGDRDFAWWIVLFERYGNFLLHHADLAARQNLGALVLGGEWLAPALPEGVLADGSPSGVPADAEARWRALIEEIRSRYKGTLLWAMPAAQDPPAFLDALDGVYLLWSAPLVVQGDSSETAMAAEAGRLLDAQALPFQSQSGKLVILGLAYPSAAGGASGCLPAPQGGCLALDALSPPNHDIAEVKLDLGEQVRAYSAMLLAVNERPWIGGVVSRGYYPPAILHDKSISIHGKPAVGVLWHWFPLLLSSAP